MVLFGMALLSMSSLTRYRSDSIATNTQEEDRLFRRSVAEINVAPVLLVIAKVRQTPHMIPTAMAAGLIIEELGAGRLL